MSSDQKETCFVIMPFGEKEDDGKIFDFDRIYKDIIKDAIEDIDMECIRCDEIGEAGWIHADMMEHIFEDDVAIVDISTENINVYYELGVRHALRDKVTVLIRKKGTKIPFNLKGFRVIDYDPEDENDIAQVKTKIAEFVQNGLKSEQPDSLVHQVLDTLKIGTNPNIITKSEIFKYSLSENPEKKVCLITGDIKDVDNIDIWVNSENTNMQMARFFDRSISALIRYLGAKKDLAGHITEDTIANELAGIMGDHKSVPAGHVLVTGSGELENTHNVKHIFHAASVQGQLSVGYRPIEDIGACVTKALKEVDLPKNADEEWSSILFPLMGAGTGRGDVRNSASELIEAAIAYLEKKLGSKIEEVYFLCWRDIDLETCQSILNGLDSVVELE